MTAEWGTVEKIVLNCIYENNANRMLRVSFATSRDLSVPPFLQSQHVNEIDAAG